jgi:hypothetical protein
VSQHYCSVHVVFTYVAGCRQQYDTCSPACMFKFLLLYALKRWFKCVTPSMHTYVALWWSLRDRAGAAGCRGCCMGCCWAGWLPAGSGHSQAGGPHCRTQQHGLPSCRALAPRPLISYLVLASYVCAVVECGGSRVVGMRVGLHVVCQHTLG